MDYKKIIKSRKTREAILRMLRFIPDKAMISLQYRIKTGRKLNLTQPERYTEKLQWYKLFYRDPLMVQCADKYEVRAYVESVGLGHLLNENYGVFTRIEDINFDDLPNEFVIKDTLGGGGDRVIVCKDKRTFDLSSERERMQRWLDEPLVKTNGREWVYYEGKPHRIIIEKYLVAENDDLPDYKFFCFDGKLYCSYFMENYTKVHEDGRLGFLDPDFNLMPAHRADFAPLNGQPEKPKNYEAMVEAAKILSKGFPAVRVDFFDIDGQIYFGELTFFMASGYIQFEPDAFDFELGKQFVLPERNH